MKELNITNLRKSLKMTQLGFCEKFGISQSYLSEIENKKKPLGDELYKSILNSLGEQVVNEFSEEVSDNIANDINNRIRKIIDDNFNGELSAFCSKLNLSQALVITTLERSKPSYSMIMSILEDEYIKVNMKWLLAGEGEPYQTKDNANPQISYTTGVPYYNVDFIGGFDLVMNDQTINPEYLINFKKYNDATCWCNVTGHSMEPEINNGDMIALKEVVGWREYLPFGEVYGIVTDEHRTIKRVTASSKGDGFLRLIPTNKSEEYQPQDIPTRLIIAVYKVLGCNKRL